MDIKAEKARLAAMTAQGHALNDEAEALLKAGKATEAKEKSDQVDKIIEEGVTIRKAIERAVTLGGMAALSLEPNGESKTAHLGKPGEGANAEPYTGRKSKGTRFIESAQFKAMALGEANSARFEMKAILGETALSGGETIRADRQTEVVALALQRPPSVIDLVNHSQTTLNSVDYVRMTGRTDGAAIAGENTEKVASDLAFDVITVAVKVIATYIKASTQILMDAPNLRNLIDNELEYMVRLKLENVVIADMIANAGQSRVHKVSGRAFAADDTIADTIRRAITDIRLEFYEANGVVLHPTQSEAMELDKASDGHYTMVYDPVAQRVWRVRVVETPAITSGTMLIGNFLLGYTVWDRMQPAVELGYIDKDFIMNMVTIRGELRAAYGTVRPKAIEKATGA